MPEPLTVGDTVAVIAERHGDGPYAVVLDGDTIDIAEIGEPYGSLQPARLAGDVHAIERDRPRTGAVVVRVPTNLAEPISPAHGEVLAAQVFAFVLVECAAHLEAVNP